MWPPLMTLAFVKSVSSGVASPTHVADSSEAIQHLAAVDNDEVSADHDSIDSLAVLESENHVPVGPGAEAPMHLDDHSDESLDVDIDEATPNPEPAVDYLAPNAEAINLVAVAEPPVAPEDNDDFSDSANKTMDLTDLIDLPANMEDGDEIDID